MIQPNTTLRLIIELRRAFQPMVTETNLPASLLVKAPCRRVVTLHIACLIVLSLLLTWPLLIYGIPDLSHDGYHHARWAKQFAAQFWQGDLFPRWFANVNGGFGGPSGFFYPPLTSYVSTLFSPLLGAHDPGGWLAAGYAVVLGEILSGISAYLWLLSFGSAAAALLGSVVYILAPYHLAVEVYMRGASAEFWVFVWFPLLLWAAQKLIRGSKWTIPVAAVSFALAVLSHPTVSLCFAPIPVSLVLCFSETKERLRNAALMAAALLLGIGLSAAYLLPAVLDQGKANTEAYRAGRLDYHNEWLIQDREQLSEMLRYVSGADVKTLPGTSWDFPFKVRMVAVTLSTLLVIAVLFVLIRRCDATSQTRRAALFWTSTAFVFFFLMTSLSSFLWALLVFPKFLQFPFRMNTMLVVCIAALATLAYGQLLQPRARLFTGFLCVMLIAWLAADLYASRWNFSTRGVGNPERVAMYKPLWRTQMDPQEMLPVPGNARALSDIAAFDLFSATHPPKAVQLEVVSRTSTGTAVVKQWRPRRVVLTIDALRDTTLTVNHFYYSGWQARIERTNQRLAVRPSLDGLMEVDVPQGSYDLVLELPKTGSERAGILISVLSLLLVGVAASWAWRCRPDVAGT